MTSPAASHPNWIAPSLIPVHLVCGPPAAGKSRFVQERASAADLILDLDAIVAELSDEPLTHEWDAAQWLAPALAQRNARLAALSKPSQWQQCWFIVGEPKPQARLWWRTTLGPGTTYVILTPPSVCVARLATDPLRNPARQSRVVSAWWRAYRPAHGDTLVRHDALHLPQCRVA